MNVLKSSIMLLFAAIMLQACNAQTSEIPKSDNVISEDLQVYYFHNTKRCATCNAVEEETLIALEMFYEQKVKAGTIEFMSLNLEEDEGKKMAETLKVSGQTLLLVKGENKVNLTNEGFMNARTNPAKFHEIIKKQIDKLL